MKFKIIFCVSLCFVVFSLVFAATTTPSLVTKINSAFTKIQGYLVKIATPIAGVTIASGILVRKLSFGDERKMHAGKKMITNAVIGYAAIRLLDLILSFIETVVK